MTDKEGAVSWRAIFSAYWYKIDDQNAEGWESELMHKRRGIPGLRMAELSEAVGELGGTWTKRTYPRLIDIRNMILQMRLNKGQSNASSTIRKGCGMCRGGWMYVRPKTGRYADTYPSGRHSGVSVPCSCPSGERWMHRYYRSPEQREEITVWRREELERQRNEDLTNDEYANISNAQMKAEATKAIKRTSRSLTDKPAFGEAR